MLKLIDDGTINGKIAKAVFEEMYQTGKTSEEVVKEKGLTQITDNSEILKIIDQIIEANPSQLEEFRGGKEKLLGFFVGQVMKQTKGQANPGIVNQLLKEKLKAP
jgi:aspartyl-tRNA(Asn)/glutamyl-tRNA(Gln) amidotransferase subunit B